MRKTFSQIILNVACCLIALWIVVKEVITFNQSETTSDLVFQFSSLLIVPLLFFLLIKLNRLRKNVFTLNFFLEESNKHYIFNSAEEIDYNNSEEIRGRFLSNLRQATDFIQNISRGNYKVEWVGLTEKNRNVNVDNIAAALIHMREQMKSVKEQDEMRIWLTEGLNKFGDHIRKHQHESSVLFDVMISDVVKYLDAKVGGLFTMEEKGNGLKFLQLKACYAYDRKKFIEKEIALGDGIISECYLDGHTIYLRQVPKNYMSITSGLGEANPTTLVLIPLKTNDGVEGVIEIASLNEFKPYQIEFLEKLGQLLAATIRSIRIAESTSSLLTVSQSQTEEMRAQEEEMRQNVEELESIQEQMNRQIKELNSLKVDLEKERYLFAALMDNLPDAIYFKDRDCKLIRVSRHMVKAFGIEMDQLIGKSDFDFQDKEHAQAAYDDEQNIMRTRSPRIDFEEKETRQDGSVIWVSSTKMPLIDSQGEVVGTFGVSKNITNYKKLEERLAAMEMENEKKTSNTITESI
jgi:methyl-accepting chemotaxis protein